MTTQLRVIMSDLWSGKKVKQFRSLKVLILRSSLEVAKNKVKQFSTFSWALMQAITSLRDKKVKQFLKPFPVLGLRYL